MSQLNFFRNGACRSEKIAYLFMYYIWGYAFFGALLAVFSQRLPIFGRAVPYASYIVTVSLFLFSYTFLKKRIKVSDIIFWVLYCLLFAISYVLHPQNNLIQKEYALETMLFTYPYLFLGLNIDINVMRKPMARISCVVILWFIFYCFIYLQNKIGSMQDNAIHEHMYYAYLVLPHVLMCIWSAFKDKNLFSLLGSILGLFLLFSFGNRGSIVDVVFFVLIYMALFINSRWKYVLYLLMAIIGCILYYYMDIIVVYFQRLLSEMGMSTRFFDFLAEGSFWEGASVGERFSLLSILRLAIIESPLFGYGFCGSWQFIDTYPHNIFYDLAITFGPILGIFLFFLLVILVYKAYNVVSNTDEKGFLIILFITGFIKLFMSYTFLNNVETFLMIGYCLCLIRKRKNLHYPLNS